MKPLPPRPPTAEDLEVWALVIGRFAVSNGEYYTRMWTDWRLCDRHDAELMHWAAVWRHDTNWEGVLFYGGELPFGGSHYLEYT